MSANYPEELADIIVNSVIELGESEPGLKELKSMAAKDNSKSNQNIAMIGILGEHLSGFVALQADEEFIRKSMPVQTDEESDIEDWYGELANRVAGLTKASCLKAEVDFAISIPQIVELEDFNMFEQNIGPIESLSFAGPTGELNVMYCFSISSGLKFSGEEKQDNVIGDKGSGVVF